MKKQKLEEKSKKVPEVIVNGEVIKKIPDSFTFKPRVNYLVCIYSLSDPKPE